MAPGLFDIRALKEHFGAELLAIDDFGQWGQRWHYHRDRNIQQIPVVSEPQGMIAGRRGNDATALPLRLQLQQGIASAAFFETARALEELQFAKNLAPRGEGKRHRMRTRRALDSPTDTLGGTLNVFNPDPIDCIALPSLDLWLWFLGLHEFVPVRQPTLRTRARKVNFRSLNA